MRKSILALAAVLAPGVVHADDAGVKTAAGKLVNFAIAVEDGKTKGAEVANHGHLRPASSECDAALKEAEKAGAGDDTRLYAYGWPNTMASYEYDSMKGASVTLKAARKACKEYAVWQPLVKAAGAVLVVTEHLANAKANGTGIGAYIAKDGQTCLDLIDGLDASSLDLDVKIGDQTMNLTAGRAICKAFVEEAAGQKEANDAAAAEKRAAIEAKWKKVGMKGKRLQLFVENELNGGGFDWYAAGCQKVISDPKKLAKAKKLFMWTAGANGGTLVSKYVFKGNKYTETAREFFSEAKAYRFCR
jgi:hypothetical protein